MNTLAINDLHSAYGALKHLRDEPIISNEAISTLIDTSLWLCHVCQALSEENDELRNALADHILRYNHR